jgi:hypothetical protein
MTALTSSGGLANLSAQQKVNLYEEAKEYFFTHAPSYNQQQMYPIED